MVDSVGPSLERSPSDDLAPPPSACQDSPPPGKQRLPMSHGTCGACNTRASRSCERMSIPPSPLSFVLTRCRSGSTGLEPDVQFVCHLADNIEEFLEGLGKFSGVDAQPETLCLNALGTDQLKCVDFSTQDPAGYPMYIFSGPPPWSSQTVPRVEFVLHRTRRRWTQCLKSQQNGKHELNVNTDHIRGVASIPASFYPAATVIQRANRRGKAWWGRPR